ncbi:MAG: hypothetical protein WA485_10640, partial [Candidatus Sulfotelmatobacter sp.]
GTISSAMALFRTRFVMLPLGVAQGAGRDRTGDRFSGFRYVGFRLIRKITVHTARSFDRYRNIAVV